MPIQPKDEAEFLKLYAMIDMNALRSEVKAVRDAACRGEKGRFLSMERRMEQFDAAIKSVEDRYDIDLLTIGLLLQYHYQISGLKL